jgi:Fe-Mn family superoxide dismutase
MTMTHELPILPYSRDALEPHLSAETIDYHYGKHHQSCVNTLNELVRGTEYEGQSLYKIIGSANTGPIYNNAAEVWNHNLYWECLSPQGGGEPTKFLAKTISRNFGSFDIFKERFTQAAIDLFGVGWIWLVHDGEGVVSIVSTNDAANPLSHGRLPLLACDVWEHAFYIDYPEEKCRYMKAFWSIVNWPLVEQRLTTRVLGSEEE